MSRSRLVFVCLFAALFFCNSRCVANDHPNIVVILVDDMGYGDPGCYNPNSKIETPAIDGLAAAGMRFTDAHAPGPLCHLSRYGLMTGRYPFRAQPNQWREKAVIEADRVTLPSMLKDVGYRTAMVGKWHLGFEKADYDQPQLGGPVDRGFDSFFGIRASTDIPPYFYIRDRAVVQTPTKPIEAGAPVEPWTSIQGKFWREGQIAPDLKLIDVMPRFTEEAISVIEDHAKQKIDQPLMLYLAYPAPHTPWLPTDTFVGKSQSDLYGDFVAMVDAEIGRVLATLDSTGMTKNTMVVFTSDNGPVWYDKDVERLGHDSAGGLRGMKADAWEAGHRMPFIVRWPGTVEPGSITDQTICFTDLLRTAAEIVGAEIRENVGQDGFSFLPVLNGSQPSEQPIRPAVVMAAGQKSMMIRAGKWKLINQLGSGGFSKPSKVKPKQGWPTGQLYDLESDVAESKNLFAQHPDIVAKLSVEMEQIKTDGHSRVAKRVIQTDPKIIAAIKKTRPNIVLVMADDQGWGQTSYNGHPLLKTPNLDAMAANGLRFNRFYAAAPVCSPTRAAVLTGRTNRRTGVESHGYALRQQEPTLVQALWRYDYATGHFGKWHLNGLRGPGVPIFADDPYSPAKFGFEQWISVSNFFDMNPVMSRGGEFEEFQGDSSEVIVDEAIKFIAQQKSLGKPSFTVIWFGTPHNPFWASEEDKQPFADLDEDSKTQLGELVAMDRSIGKLRAALRELEIADDTLVWFTSDNGGLPKLKPSTVGDLRGFKGSLYEGGVRVPAIIEWPAKIKSRVTDFPAVSMDIFPTIAHLTNMRQTVMLHQNDGMSLLDLFDGEIERREKPIPFDCLGNAAVIDNEWKLLHVSPNRNKPNTFELYNLDDDPSEQDNLFVSQPEIAERMMKLFHRQTESIERSVAGLDYPERTVSPPTPEPKNWTDEERYKPFFEQWKNRPEYQSRLKKTK